MPKAKKKDREHGAQSVANLVVCKCKSRCLNFNEATGRHEGSGVLLNPRREEVQEIQAQPLDALTLEEGWINFIRVQREFLRELPVVSHSRSLKFLNNPTQHGRYQHQFDHDDETETTDPPPPNTGVHSLDPSAPENRGYIERENTLWELYRIVGAFHQTDDAIGLGHRLYEDLASLEREKEMQWESLRGCSSGNPTFNTAIFFRQHKRRNPKVEAASLVSLVLQYHYFLPRRGCEVYLAGTSDVHSTSSQGKINPSFPVDPRPLSRNFNLDPITSTYVSCASCHCLYGYDPNLPDVPEKCTFKQARQSSPCDADLWKTVNRGPFGTVKAPVRTYLHQGLKGWLGRMLSRPGMEETMYRYPRGLMEDRTANEVTDIWQGEIFRNLKVSGSPDFFFPGPPGELRLAFSMSIDGFSPFQNKTAKQTASSTGIWLVLLNLPWHLRYLPQNIYLAGVIPGPNKPSNDQINHYVQLVVNDMKDLYRPGIFFSRTYDLQQGRLCKGLLIPLICDLLAAHQVIGYPGAPTAHYFCTCCELDIHDINVIDRNEWPKKDIHHIRRYASIYRNASSERHQQSAFDACGWRWSPLLELDYWDPPMFTSIDSMHSLDLNVLKHHVRDLFQIDLKHKGGLALRPNSAERIKRVTYIKAEVSMLRSCQESIYENGPQLMYELLGFHRKVLFSFCLDYDIRNPGQNLVTGTRWILAKSIYKWRQNRESPGLQSFQTRFPSFSETQEKLIEESKEGEADEEDEQEEGELAGGSDGGVADPRPQADPDEVVPPVPKHTVLRRLALQLLRLVEEEEEDTSAVYRKITVNLLNHFCEALQLNQAQSDQGDRSKTAKQRLFQFLLTNLQESVALRETLKELFAGEAQVLPDSSAFLGKDVMEKVWDDMTRTRLPSWVTPVPHDWGTSRRGKLSADNWRVICCIHLPITLIRLFGESDGRQRELLDNFMTLVSAVRIATRSKSSSAHIDAYNELMLSYTKGTLELFRDYSVLPSHHAALHIGDMLQRFGPKHSHDSPYYERYILLFHRMNTNHKIGEVEGTLLRTAVRNANLVALLGESPEAQEMLKHTTERMRMHSSENVRGFRLIEASDPLQMVGVRDDGRPQLVSGTTVMNELDYQLLCKFLRSSAEERDTPVTPQATYLEHVSHQHAVYAVWGSKKYKDSAVLYQGSTGRRAGVIQKIFLHHHAPSSGEPSISQYIVVLEYQLVDAQRDPFRKYGDAGGFCCDSETNILAIVPLQNVVSHVAVTELEADVIHVLPISRTSLSLEGEWIEDALGTRNPS